MPVITLEAASLNKEQKKQLVKEFTESAARIMNMPKDSFYVFLKENALTMLASAASFCPGKNIPDPYRSRTTSFFYGIPYSTNRKGPFRHEDIS